MGTVELRDDDDLTLVRRKVAAISGVHMGLQYLVYGRKLLEEWDNEKTVAEYGIGQEDVLRLAARPEEIAVRLNVGGMDFSTQLSTLVEKFPASVISKMFAAAYDGLAEGGKSTVVVPQPPDAKKTTWFIDRDGPSFNSILNYLRHDTATATTECPLPRDKERREQLAVEAEYYGLHDLAAACHCPLRVFMMHCGIGVTVDEVMGLTEAERASECENFGMSLADHRRIEELLQRRTAKKAQARQAAEDLVRLRLGLRRLDLSKATVAALAAAGLALRDVLALDAAAARRLGLSEEDARKVEESVLGREFVFKRVDNSVAGHGKFDEAGVLNHIGTAGGTRAWVNPCLSGDVSVAWSSVDDGSGSEEMFVSKFDWKAEESNTKDEPNSWMRVDLGATRSLAVNHYALRHDSSADYILRNWELQGSNAADGSWTTLRHHDNDASIEGKAGFVAAWPVEGEACQMPFRFFRIHQHGANSCDGQCAGDEHYLVCAGIELYGVLTGFE